MGRDRPDRERGCWPRISGWFKQGNDESSQANRASKRTKTVISAPIAAHPQGLLQLQDDRIDMNIDPQRHVEGPGFQFMSDLHLERSLQDGRDHFSEIPQIAPYLILAGDIGRLKDTDALDAFIAQQCSRFEQVFLVLGNHEFYGTSRTEGLRAAADLSSRHADKLVLMDRTCSVLHHCQTVVLGCTLHSFIPDMTALTNDFQYIHDWKVMHHNAEHITDQTWLRETLASVHVQYPQYRVIVATHYAPAFELTAHPSQESNNVRHCFCSNTLLSLQDGPGFDRISHWIFGHTHYNTRASLAGVSLVSNQPEDARCRRKFDLDATV